MGEIMETKLIFFDIDGTLLNEKTFKVSSSTKKAIQLAQKNGHKCIINTGRVICTIDQAIQNIPFDGYICGCGTYIEYDNQEIFHVEIDKDIRQKVIEQSLACHVDSVFEGKEGVYFPKCCQHAEVERIKQHYINEGMPIFEYDSHDYIAFDKLTAWYQDSAESEQFKTFLRQHFEVIQRDTDFIEVIPLGYSKATGIQFFTDYLHNSIENTISIGDSTNDLPMLTYTKESVAMGNSHPILFNQVTYITTDIDHDGIYNALKHFQII